MADQESDQQPAPVEEPAPKRPERRSRVRRGALYALALVTAVVAALIVTLFSVDLGPYVKGEAERRGAAWLDRPMTIGSIRALLRPGQFEFRDLVIQGLEPGDRPFLVAKSVVVSLPWWTIFNRELIVESVEMTGWTMYIESFPGGRHNFPRVKGPDRPPRPPDQPRRFTTTMRRVIASGGEVTYVDHGTPWSIVAPNMRVELFRRPARNDYGGTAAFDGATIRIQSYEPFGAKMDSRLSMVAPNLHFDRIDLVEGSEGFPHVQAALSVSAYTFAPGAVPAGATPTTPPATTTAPTTSSPSGWDRSTWAWPASPRRSPTSTASFWSSARSSPGIPG